MHLIPFFLVSLFSMHYGLKEYDGPLPNFFWVGHRYVLESQHMKKFFDYIQLPNFDIAADAAATFKVECS